MIQKISIQLVAFVCLLFLGATLANAQHAQDGQSSPVPTSLSTTIEQVQDVASPLFVAETITRQQSLLGTDPFLTQFDGRTDFGNAAQIEQKGDRNVTILQQYGVQNVASIRLEGDDNTVDATQDGNQNVLGVSVLGSGNEIPVAQIGDGNELSLELVNVNDLLLNPPVGIQQTGGGVPLIVRITPGSP